MREPEKYRWKPQELLAQLAHIYLHLSAADARGGFVAAIAQDGRSYHEGLFSDAADVRLHAAKLSSSAPSCQWATGAGPSSTWTLGSLAKGCQCAAHVQGCHWVATAEQVLRKFGLLSKEAVRRDETTCCQLTTPKPQHLQTLRCCASTGC